MRRRRALQAAIEAYQRSDFASAERQLSALLAKLGEARDRLAQEAHTYMAFVQAAYGRADRAMTSFERALAIKPDLKLPEASPKLTRLFEQARRRWRAKLRALDHDPPRLGHRPPKGPLRYGASVPITVEVRDRSPVKDVTLSYRIAGHRGFASLRMERSGEGRYLATLPTISVVRPGVEYFIEAWDALGNGPGLKGSARAPIRLTVEGGPLARPAKLGPRPWYKRWWVWAIAAGAVAAAAGVSVGAYLGRDQRGRITIDNAGGLP